MTHSILGLNEGIVDGDDLDIVVLNTVPCISSERAVGVRGSRVAVDLDLMLVVADCGDDDEDLRYDQCGRNR